MLLTCLLVGFLLILTIFAIALVWDCTHGISLFGNNMKVAIVEPPMRESNDPASLGEKALEPRTDSNWQKEEGRRATITAQAKSMAA